MSLEFFSEAGDFVLDAFDATGISSKLKQKSIIRSVIAPGIVGEFENLNNTMKKDEEELIHQLKSHQYKFTSQFKDNAAKGDWVDSAIEDIENITKKFNNL